MNLILRSAVATLSLACAAAAYAAGAADAVAVSDPTVRLMPPGAKATAAFMTLKNSADKSAKLVKAESAAAKTAELHNHINDNGVMKMRQVPAIELKANADTKLAPGGYHIMLIDPAALKEGDKVAITLGFDDGSSKTVEAIVKKPEAAPGTMAPAGQMGHMNHDHKH